MPPRVREVVRMLEEIGFRFERRGKGDHNVYRRGAEQEVLAGAPNKEMGKSHWEKLRKRYDLKG